MWKALSILNVLVVLILTRLIKADYYEYDQYRHNTASFKCTKEGYHPDSQDCRVYYRCVDWGNGSPLTTFRFECGVGTVFSKNKGDICTHPEDSGRPECGSENAIDLNLPESPDTSLPIWTTTKTTTQLITAQTSVTTRPSTFTTEVFTTTRKSEIITQPSQTNPPTTDQSENSVINCQNRLQCVQEEFLADTCDCAIFYRCVDEGYGSFKQYKFKCGIGTVWDPKIQGCNHAWAVARQNCKQNSENGSENENDGQWNNNIEDNDGQWNGDVGSSGSSDIIPGLPGTPNFPGTPGSPGTPGTPDSSGYPGTSGFPGTPSSPGTPGSSGTAGTPGSSSYPGTPSFPGISGSPETPESLGTADIPGSPGFPETPGSSDTPSSPGTPGSPDISGSPSSSGYPGTPGSSGTSESPGTPGTPGSSGTPGSPGISDSPGSSGSPGTLGSPGTSESPGTTGTPGISGSSGTPDTPGSQGYPGTSGSPGIPSSSGALDSSSSSSSQHPTGICTNEGFFADPENCSKFYRCVKSGMSFTKYEFKCGVGTVWDSSVESCNHAYAVPHCNQPSDVATNKPVTSLNEVDSINKPAISELPPVQSAESSTLSTSSQLEIQSSTQIIFTTSKPALSQTTSVSYLPPASSTYPSSTTQVIESASNLPSNNHTTTISYLPPSNIETTNSPEPISGSVSYLPPDNSTPIKPTNTPNFESSPAFLPQSEKSECTGDGFFPNSDNCRKFYRCVQDQSGYTKYEFQCGPGTAWDQSIQTCNHIAQVPCSTDSNEIDQSSGPSTSSTTPKISVTSAVTTATSATTATTLLSAAPISSTESTTVASALEISTELSMSEANKTESSTTTVSASGKPEEIQMPESSSTESSSESTSSSSELSEESSSSIESHVSDCTTQKPNNTIVCNDEGFYPHPIWCNKFYRCVNNNNGFNVYHFDCPPGTIFDPSISTCNYPESIYPARDCTTGEAASVSITSTDVSIEPTQPQSETEQPTSTENATESTTQQTEESTSASEETTTLEESPTGSEELTSEIPENTESLTESTTESAIPSTEAAIDFSTSEQTTESTTEAITSTESTEIKTSTTEFQEQITTEAQEQSTIELQEQSTIQSQESQEQFTTELSESTTVEPAAAESCAIGNLTDNQIALICPTGFRRHPKYCNLFYQCTNEDNMEIKILMLSCPQNTIFDEQKIQCLPEDKSSQSCTKTSARLYRRVEDSSLSSIKVSTNKFCPREGHFPYRQGCSNTFYKCKRDVQNSLQGYMYKCPENYVYWSVSRTCERVTRLPMCSHLTYRNKTNWNNQWQIPTENFNLSAQMLRFS